MDYSAALHLEGLCLFRNNRFCVIIFSKSPPSKAQVMVDCTPDEQEVKEIRADLLSHGNINIIFLFVGGRL
ncbi:hypothetical protein L1987_71287 [Smallanthus sonchifolius]|uniref:Uncharacterized protein n=1 Tax=Smallanthus sonchifolius TaxID=185202 RepID=A0ACB9ASA9_9ASTR|nr:hypothetical protein L1987_71287 [Smallanthus sonchifolius]